MISKEWIDERFQLHSWFKENELYVAFDTNDSTHVYGDYIQVDDPDSQEGAKKEWFGSLKTYNLSHFDHNIHKYPSDLERELHVFVRTLSSQRMEEIGKLYRKSEGKR